MGDEKIEVVEVALGRGSANEECDVGRREYWIVRHATPLSIQRVAVDCDHQTTAGGLAHADIHTEGSDLVVAYEELQGGDRCEGVDARFHLSPFHLVNELRYVGAYGAHHCRRENEITTNWDASDHVARFAPANCDLKRDWTYGPKNGAAIPRFAVDESSEPTAIGSCGVIVDAARAARWMKSGAIASSVRLLAMVVNDRLLIDVEGASTGSLSVVAVAGSGDAYHGGPGCPSQDERRVSVTTLHLEDGRVEKKGLQPPFLKVSARDGAAVHLTTGTIAGIGRVALSYESPHHEKLDSAFLPHSPPTNDEIPPIYGSFKAAERCELVAGRLDVRSNNAQMDPALVLQDRWKGQ